MPQITTLSPLLYGFGLLAVAGALFALQRLRVRHRTERVVTTLFWKEAVEESRARVLVRRFRHPWTYLLLLAIASLLWSAAATPRRVDERAPEHLVLLDASSKAGAKGGWPAALETVDALLERLPDAGRSVVFCGATPRTLLRAGEDAHLFRERVNGLEPEACPSGVGALLRERVVARGGERPLVVHLVGDVSVAEETLASLPSTVRLERVAFERPAFDNSRAIRALGATPAISGAQDRVDLHVLVRGPIDAGNDLELRLDGEPLNTTASTRALPGSPELQACIVSDLPAAGGRVSVSLREADDHPADDSAELVLPVQRLLKVHAAATTPGVVRALLAADPGLELVDLANAEVVVGAASDQLPAFRFSGDQGAAFGIVHEDGVAVESLWERSVGLGLLEIDAEEIAERAGRSISVDLSAGTRRELRVWASLFSDDSPFLDDRAFPLFVARGVRWLGKQTRSARFAACGDELEVDGANFEDAKGRRIASFDGLLRPQRAGVYRAGTEVVAVTLGERPAPAAGPAGEEPRPWRRPFRLTQLLLLGAFVLLLVEWQLHRSGRIP